MFYLIKAIYCFLSSFCRERLTGSSLPLSSIRVLSVRRCTCSRFTRMLKWLRQNRLPFRRGSRPEKLWLIYNTSPPLQVDGRFMVGGFCVEDVPGIHSPPAAVCQELDLFRMIIIPQNPVDYTCQLFPVNRFEQVVKRPGVKPVENIVPVSGDIDNGAI